METGMSTLTARIGQKVQTTHATVTKNNALGFELVPLDLIDPDPHNIRLGMESDPELPKLAADIKRNGVIQAISLSRVGERFVINFGHRRYAAALLAGLSSIPAVIVPQLARGELAWLQYSENDKRLAMTRYEKTIHAIKRMCEQLSLSEEKVVAAIWSRNEGKPIEDGTAAVIDEVLARMDITISTFAVKYLRTQKYPMDVIDALLKRRINENEAALLARFEDEEIRNDRLEKLVSQALTALEIEQELKQSRVKGQTVTEKEVFAKYQDLKIDQKVVKALPMAKRLRLERLIGEIAKLLND
jgi:ParB family transcriptional regulator, chromosome partitioning protein